MMRIATRAVSVLFLFTLMVADSPTALAQRKSTRMVRLTHSLVTEELVAASFTEVGPGSKHLYVTSWRGNSILVFDCDPRNGSLTLSSSLVNHPQVAYPTDFNLTPDGRYGVTSCVHGKTATLLRRDPDSGRLEVVDSRMTVMDENDHFSLPIDIAISTDGRFAYVSDCVIDRSVTSNSENRGRIAVFEISDEKLHPVESFAGHSRSLDGVRGLTMHPGGRMLLAASYAPGALVVLQRDPKTGRLKETQSLSSESIRVLTGAVTPACSPDGRFVYTASGRFGEADSDHGVGVFQFGNDGKLRLVQEINVKGMDDYSLRGGNQIEVSRDGERVFVSGTTSGTFASFFRDQKTGKLELEQEVSADTQATLRGANGIAESHDGRFLYVTGETAGAINVFRVYKRQETSKPKPDR